MTTKCTCIFYGHINSALVNLSPISVSTSISSNEGSNGGGGEIHNTAGGQWFIHNTKQHKSWIYIYTNVLHMEQKINRWSYSRNFLHMPVRKSVVEWFAADVWLVAISFLGIWSVPFFVWESRDDFRHVCGSLNLIPPIPFWQNAIRCCHNSFLFLPE